MTAVLQTVRRRLRRRDRFVTNREMNGPRIVRARLWWRTRRQGSLLQAPLRVTGAGAPMALDRITIGRRTRIGHGAWFSLVDREARIVLGSSCTLSASLSISVAGSVEIGDGTGIGERCLITDHGHDHLTYLEPAVTDGVPLEISYDTTEARPVRIGSGVHIGANVYIGPGVTVGDGAVIGVNSVVTRSVPPYTVVVGIPARPVRTLVPEAGDPAGRP
jgi:acetyltransferase-like isoleucine patch superfamily enzyme